MSDFVSSRGKREEDLRLAAMEYGSPDTVCVRITIRNFQDLVDRNGHTVRLDLPGALCSFVRAYPGCKYAEVLRTSHLADACIVAVVEDQAALTRLITALPSQRFTLDRLVLQCPPLETEAGTLDDVLGSEPETG